ncbi:MAG: hypothetical protein Q8T09_01770 [Candidatus Melainabacteria bacterium]|nr:hypothetical protein [Candidatus Melainabacteria bacterium]
MLVDKFQALAVANNFDNKTDRPAAAPPASNSSAAINYAIETANSAVKLLRTYPKPYSDKSIFKVQCYLNVHCPKDFVSIAIRIFNESCGDCVVAEQNNNYQDPIRLRPVSTETDDHF